MNNVPAVLEVIAGVLGAIEVFNKKGYSLVGWAVILLAVALLWAKIVT